MLITPEHTAKRDAACERIQYVNTGDYVSGSIDRIKILTKIDTEVVSCKLRGTKVKTVRENKAYDDEDRHDDHEVPAHREELPLIFKEDIYNSNSHEGEPEEVRQNKPLDEGNTIVEGNVYVCNVMCVSLYKKEEHEVYGHV